jgi:hypothetical protein
MNLIECFKENTAPDIYLADNVSSSRLKVDFSYFCLNHDCNFIGLSVNKLLLHARGISKIAH